MHRGPESGLGRRPTVRKAPTWLGQVRRGVESSAGWSTYPAFVVETFGDASRNGDWAAVRLRVDGERIVDADADGLEEPLRGLTLLEAAAVSGERLAVDALAAALGP